MILLGRTCVSLANTGPTFQPNAGVLLLLRVRYIPPWGPLQYQHADSYPDHDADLDFHIEDTRLLLLV